jgi:peptidoglycan hydrolase-like protein with peptidoglycan-binding domain
MSNPVLKIRKQGPDVGRWQKFLLANDFDLGPWGADHDYFIATEQATERFQEKNSLAVKGIVGADEWGLAEKHNFGRLPNSVDAVKPDGPMDKDQIRELIGLNGYQLILDYEVGGGESYYLKYLIHPVWPEAYSGMTIGVGYDLKFNSPVQYDAAWGELITDQAITVPQYRRLRDYCEKDGSKADEAKLSDISIPWEHAERVFKEITIPRYWALTQNTFPGVASLPKPARAALLSLVFNRGGGLRGNSRRHMRYIRQAVPKRDLRAIAGHIRSMTEIWQGMSVYLGLKRRRNAEANMLLTALS